MVGYDKLSREATLKTWPWRCGGFVVEMED